MVLGKRIMILACVFGLTACAQLGTEPGAPEVEGVPESRDLSTDVSSDDNEEDLLGEDDLLEDEQQCNCPEPVVMVSPVPSQPCPEQLEKTKTTKAASKSRDDSRKLVILGRSEYVFLKRPEKTAAEDRQSGLKLKARVDTGINLSTLGAQQLVDFERDGKPWVRFVVMEKDKPVKFERPVKRYVDIKPGKGEDRRPVVNISLRMGDIEENLEMTLTNRGKSIYGALIGRNFLRDRAMVDVSRRYLADDDITYP